MRSFNGIFAKHSGTVSAEITIIEMKGTLIERLGLKMPYGKIDFH